MANVEHLLKIKSNLHEIFDLYFSIFLLLVLVLRPEILLFWFTFAALISNAKQLYTPIVHYQPSTNKQKKKKRLASEQRTF